MEFLIEKKVFPNQIGNLKKRKDLFKDQNIPEEFKNILEELDKKKNVESNLYGFRHLLLDKNITVLKDELKQKTTKDISIEINEHIRNIPYDIEIIETRNIILELLSLSPKDLNEIQKKVWEFSRAYYFDNISENIKNLDNSESFDWKPCINWVINRLTIDISELKFVDILQKEIYGSVEAIKWLDRFIELLQKEDSFKHLLEGEDYPIIPNQSGDFCKKSQLYIDDEIPDELKDIIKRLNTFRTQLSSGKNDKPCCESLSRWT